MKSSETLLPSSDELTLLCTHCDLVLSAAGTQPGFKVWRVEYISGCTISVFIICLKQSSRSQIENVTSVDVP